MPVTKGKKPVYSIEDMQNAVSKVLSKEMGFNEAARKYKIPRGTLHDKVFMKTSLNRNYPGREPFLSAREEERLWHRIQAMFSIGYGRTRVEIPKIVKEILDKGEIKSKFKDNLPSFGWTSKFLARHKELSLRIPESLGHLRAEVSPKDIENYNDLVIDESDEMAKGKKRKRRESDLSEHPSKKAKDSNKSTSETPEPLQIGRSGRVIKPKKFADEGEKLADQEGGVFEESLTPAPTVETPTTGILHIKRASVVASAATTPLPAARVSTPATENIENSQPRKRGRQKHDSESTPVTNGTPLTGKPKSAVKKRQDSREEMKELSKAHEKGETQLGLIEEGKKALDASKAKYLRIEKMPVTKGKKPVYSIEDMQNAVSKVLSKEMGFNEAARKYKIPRGTLHDKVFMKTSLNRNYPGREPFLSAREEERLCHRIQAMFSIGYGRTRAEIPKIVKEILDKGEIKSKFKDNLPTSGWTSKFLARHKELSLRIPKSLGHLRAEVSPKDIENYNDLVIDESDEMAKGKKRKRRESDLSEHPSKKAKDSNKSTSETPEPLQIGRSGRVIKPKKFADEGEKLADQEGGVFEESLTPAPTVETPTTGILPKKRASVAASAATTPLPAARVSTPATENIENSQPRKRGRPKHDSESTPVTNGTPLTGKPESAVKKREDSREEMKELSKAHEKGETQLGLIEEGKKALDASKAKYLRIEKMPVTKGKKPVYSIEDMQNAVSKVLSKEMGFNEAARKYKIPRGTLHDKVFMKTSLNRNYRGREPFLSAREEERLCHWIQAMFLIGYGRTRAEIPKIVKEILDKGEIKSNFKDNLPTSGWTSKFLARHKELSLRIPKSLGHLRAEVSPKDIENYNDLVIDESDEMAKGKKRKRRESDLSEHPSKKAKDSNKSTSETPEPLQIGQSGRVIKPKKFADEGEKLADQEGGVFEESLTPAPTVETPTTGIVHIKRASVVASAATTPLPAARVSTPATENIENSQPRKRGRPKHDSESTPVTNGTPLTGKPKSAVKKRQDSREEMKELSKAHEKGETQLGLIEEGKKALDASKAKYLRIEKMPVTKGKKPVYSIEDMQNAVSKVLSKEMGFNEAARKYKIPRGTLHDKVFMKTSLNRNYPGREPYLSAREEERLCHWIQAMFSIGYGLTRAEIPKIVKEMLDKGEIKSKFKDNLPTSGWTLKFLARHKELSLRIPKSLGHLRAEVSPKDIENYNDLVIDESDEMAKGKRRKRRESDLSEHPSKKAKDSNKSTSETPEPLQIGQSGRVIKPKKFADEGEKLADQEGGVFEESLTPAPTVETPTTGILHIKRASVVASAATTPLPAARVSTPATENIENSQPRKRGRPKHDSESTPVTNGTPLTGKPESAVKKREDSREEMKELSKAHEKGETQLGLIEEGKKALDASRAKTLDIEAQLLDLYQKIREALSVINPRKDDAKFYLEKMSKLVISGLMIKKNPHVFDAIKKCRRYKYDDEVRIKANIVYNKFKEGKISLVRDPSHYNDFSQDSVVRKGKENANPKA